MAFIPAENVIKTELIYDWAGQVAENLLWFLSTEPVSELVIQTLLDLLETWVTAELLPQLSQDIELVELKGTDMTSEGSFVIESFPTSPVPGGVASASVPTNSAIVVKLTTTGSGRSARGRNYLPGLPLANLASRTEIQATPMANLIISYLELLDTPFTPDYELSVVSFQHDLAPRVTGLIQPVIGIGGDLFLDSQRRRLAGRGE